MARTLHDWLTCPACGSTEISLLEYDATLSLQCYDCRNTDEFEFGDPPFRDVAPRDER